MSSNYFSMKLSLFTTTTTTKFISLLGVTAHTFKTDANSSKHVIYCFSVLFGKCHIYFPYIDDFYCLLS